MSQLSALFEAARAVQARAYAPYSRFCVGAALRDEAGAIHAAATYRPRSSCPSPRPAV